MQESTREKGNKGEDIAVEFLGDKGFEIIKRNFHFGRVGEIDIVAKDGEVIVFIEVKSRNNDEYGDPLESITPQKQKKLRSAANGFLYVNKIVNTECRFDIIIIDFRGKLPKVKHLRNAM